MDTRLLKAGIIAIPIKSDESIGILSPSFFVIEKQEGREIRQVPNLRTGQLEDTVCSIAQYKLSQREILPPTEFKTDMMIDREIQPLEEIAIPWELLILLKDYQTIKENISTINSVFSLFSFRGSLQGLSLEVDDVILDEIITNETNQ